jgi:SAM-dependent methyltransferase
MLSLWRRPSPPAFLREAFHGELHDLGRTIGRPYRGIWSPDYEDQAVERFVHHVFRSEAQTYAHGHGAGLERLETFRGLLSLANITTARVGSILELGAGHGNSIASLLSLCSAATVIASDLSAEMLAQFPADLARHPRVVRLQLDAEVIPFAPASFDLIVGWGVLHHLFHPEKTLEACRRILKPGGCALFAEPLEEGHRVLTTLYRSLLADDRSGSFPDVLRGHFQGDILQFAWKRLPVKTLPVFRELEDKWVFPAGYFELLAQREGFTCHFQPMRISCEHKIAANMKLLGIPHHALPAWAWEKIRGDDATRSEAPAISTFIVLSL